MGFAVRAHFSTGCWRRDGAARLPAAFVFAPALAVRLEILHLTGISILTSLMGAFAFR
jgi:hypothetical protein